MYVLRYWTNIMKPLTERKKLTERQSNIYEWIKKYQLDNHGRSPSFREIGKAFDITVTGAYDHLACIAKKNYVGIIPNISRGIYIIE